MQKTFTLKIKTKKPIAIRSKKFGELFLTSILTMGDIETLLELLIDKTLDARTFTIKVLNEVAFITSNQNLSTWDDKVLLMIAKTWAKRVLFKEINENKIESFEDFRTAISRYISKTNEMMLDAMKGIQTVLASQLKSMTSQMSTALLGISKIFDSAGLIQASLQTIIPEFQKLLKSVSQAKDLITVRKMLIDSEYELATQIINTNSLIKLKGKRFKPAITNKLVKITSGTDFIKEVEFLFESASLRKRSSVIKQALAAHQNRQYYLSTAIFIAQTEGIFTDWLILSKLARRKNGKVVSYSTETTNKVKNLNSLSTKINHARENLKAEGLLKVAIDNVLIRMLDKRNSILHGEKSNYGTAKNSTQALLLVLLFAGVLEENRK